MDVIIIFICFILTFIYPIILWYIKKPNKATEITYDGMPLTIPPRKSLLYPIDCRVTSTTCMNNNDCQLLCMNDKDYNNIIIVCGQDNVCEYVDTNTYCQNNGKLITYYIHDRQYRICDCGESRYYGPTCNDLNPFKKRDWDFISTE